MRRALLILLLAAAAPAFGQTPSIQSIAPDIDIGPVVSAASGPTVFRAAASSGAVTRVGGAGYRLGAGTARALVTVSCDASMLCAEPVLVTIYSIGASGRLDPLENFTAAENTATFLSPPSGTDPMLVTLNAIGANTTASFYVGADIPVLGNDSGEPSGAASAAFAVQAAITGGDTDMDTGQAVADVFRPLTLDAESNLVFGGVIRPSSGAGSVEIDVATGARILTGTGVLGIGAPARAAFAVSGEGGQTFSVSVPQSFAMTGPGDPIEAALTHDAEGLQILSGAAGQAGEAEFHVGGAFEFSATTTPGAYSGAFEVMVQYE